MNLPLLDDFHLAGKRVLTRVDFNVPLANGRVADSSRIQRSAPTIQKIAKAGGIPVMLSHLGRPRGQYNAGLSFKAILPDLARLLELPVKFASGLPGQASTAAAIAALQAGDVLMLENLRFHSGEEKNDPQFARQLASLGDIYCNDAFAAAHRAHASTTGLAKLLPSCAGLLMNAELTALESVMTSPARPLVAIIGGSKISTKLKLLGNLARKVDGLVIGGGMANTFLAAKGVAIGSSIDEPDMHQAAAEVLATAARAHCQVLLPADAAVARELANHAVSRITPAGGCQEGEMMLDLGTKSIAAAKAIIDTARTVIWNGPLGAFEVKPFDAATAAIAIHVATRTSRGDLYSVAGGGDTLSALNAAGVASSFSYLSTAGGAFLEWMEGKSLPGVAALSRLGRRYQ